jgi:hypothetical protein
MPSYLTIGAVSTSHMRIVLADDDVLLREGLAALLGRPCFEVVGKPARDSSCCTGVFSFIACGRLSGPRLVWLAASRRDPVG